MLQPSWVLRGELALGPAPLLEQHLQDLQDQGLLAVLSLCSEQEAPPPAGLAERFHWRRWVLPDHKAGRPPELAEFQGAVEQLAELAPLGPVYVHCQAGVERSPLVCMASSGSIPPPAPCRSSWPPCGPGWRPADNGARVLHDCAHEPDPRSSSPSSWSVSPRASPRAGAWTITPRWASAWRQWPAPWAAGPCSGLCPPR
jgi:hypothetical protein